MLCIYVLYIVYYIHIDICIDACTTIQLQTKENRSFIGVQLGIEM